MSARILTMLLVLCILPFSALGEIMPDAPVEGAIFWPEGTDETNARYIFRYSLPHMQEGSDAALGINTFYRSWLEDAEAFTVPIQGESLEDAELTSWTEVKGSVTCNDAYLSVLFVTSSSLDGYAYTTYAGHTFPLTGARSGIPISLPYLLGILKEGESDTWLQDRQTAKADACVRDLIWEQIQDNSGDLVYLPDVTYEFFSEMFYPEEDFYLDEKGDPVFFIQPGILCEEEQGVLLFPLPLETILDEI